MVDKGYRLGKSSVMGIEIRHDWVMLMNAVFKIRKICQLTQNKGVILRPLIFVRFY